MKNIATAYIRTYAPILAAGIVTVAAKAGLDLGQYSDALAGIIGTIGGFAYYAAARLVGRKYPKIEALLLGSSKTPSYDK